MHSGDLTCNMWMIINVLKTTYMSNVIMASANGRLSSWAMIKSLGGSEIDHTLLYSVIQQLHYGLMIHLMKCLLTPDCSRAGTVPATQRTSPDPAFSSAPDPTHYHEYIYYHMTTPHQAS